jgi:DNA (cytosine-5)-methyltransferase 1
MNVVSLFSGCGGFDLGFKQCGFNIVWANDIDKDAIQTYKKNIGDHIVYGDIRKIPSEQIPNEFDVLIGGFPCQGFSIANSNRNQKDERNFLYKEIVRILKDKQPKVFVLENVKGLLSMEKGKVLEMILKDLSNLGYSVDYQILKASNYGVPQNRERVIFVGNRIGLENRFPKQTHFHNLDPKHISVKDAIGHLANVRTRDVAIELDNGDIIHNHTARTNTMDSFFKRVYQVNDLEIVDYLSAWKNKKGITIKDLDKEFGYKHTASHWFRRDKYRSLPTREDWIGLKKILGFDDKYDQAMLDYEEKQIEFAQRLRVSNWDTPSDTIVASGPEIHPNKERRLSARECAILQSFPNDFVFEGSLSSVYKQIGNAVPILMAREIASKIKDMLLNI